MKGVDLELFQFDYDLTWSVVFMNADGTIYGRFGTRAGVRGNQLTHVSGPAFTKAVERALAIHQRYPGNRNELAPKRGKAPRYRYAEDMPDLKQHAGKTTRQNCIHCHMVGESQLRLAKAEGKLTIEDIWSYPLPDNLGLRIDKEDGLKIRTVNPGTPAESAGLRAGDELLTMNGQPLISQGDIQWVLHHLPLETRVNVTFKRDGSTQEKTIPLSGNWKKRDISWRDSIWGIRPGLQLTEMYNNDKERSGIPVDQMGLRVKYSFRESAKAGVRNNDIVTAVDGRTDVMSEGDFLAYLYLSKPARKQVRLSLLRNGQKLEATIPAP